MEKIYLTKEVAEFLRVSEEYVRVLVRKNQLQAYKEGRRGGYRITEQAIKEYINQKYSKV
jgi:excisionase family DNA binding protein